MNRQPLESARENSGSGGEFAPGRTQLMVRDRGFEPLTPTVSR